MLTRVRQQSLVVIVIVIAISLLLGVAYPIWRSQVTIQDNFLAEHKLTVSWAQRQLDLEITSTKQAVSFLSDLLAMRDVTQDNFRQQLELICAKSMAMNPAITQVRCLSIPDNNREIVRPDVTAANHAEGLQVTLPISRHPLQPSNVVMVTYDSSKLFEWLGNRQNGFTVILDSQGNYSTIPSQFALASENIEALRQIEQTADQWHSTILKGEPYRYLTNELWLDRSSDTSLTMVRLIPEAEFSSAFWQELARTSGISLLITLTLVALIYFSFRRGQRSAPEQAVTMDDTDPSNIDPTLEQLIAARTEALNEALRHAEEATQRKSQFLAKISHELRTPLNGLGGMLAVLHRTPLSGKAVGYLDRAEGSLSILKSIVDDMLDLSKVEAGALEMEAIEFDLTKVLDTCCHSYSANADDANTRLFGDFTGINQPMVIGDPTRLHQILAHLIGNAMRFTQNGHVTVAAKTHVGPSGQILFACRIEDNGIGMPRETLHQVVKALARTNGDAIKLYRGTGLGLSICGSLIHLLKGSINVESREHEGTTFTLLVPFEAANASNSTKQPGHHLANDLTAKNIIVMTADSIEAGLIENTLRLWQCQVSFSNPEDFAARIRKPGNIDLLIIDPAQFSVSRSAIQDNLNNPTSPIFNLQIIVTHADDFTEFAVSDWPLTTTIRDPLTSSSLSHILAGIFFEEATNSHTDIPSHRHITGKLLVVDDVESNRALISAMLGEDDVEVIEAENGKQALEVLRAEPDVGLVLMDCQMPLMGGLEATEKIRQGEAGTHYVDMPIVALTAAAMKGERQACFDAGMNDYMAKPFEMKQLLSMVDTFLTTQTEKSTSGY